MREQKTSTVPRRVILSASRNFATMRFRHLWCRPYGFDRLRMTHCRKIAVGGISAGSPRGHTRIQWSVVRYQGNLHGERRGGPWSSRCKLGFLLKKNGYDKTKPSPMVGEGGAAGDGRGNAALQKTYRRILYIENSRLSPSHFSREEQSPSPTTARYIASVSV